ncbi:50S ribosomal protein L21 [Kiloniella sp. b19]|uniref:50S ribosomal protein L21 n=1 Tax=Kiloniella sp. GXU_MW_B19 TaxID=3141326 RepID=UPI0031D98B48
MFAVIKTGGKQYKVRKDDVLVVEKLNAEAGASVDFNEVLMIGDGEKATIGAPVVDGAVVKADVVEQTRGDKVVIFKKKRRKNHRRKNGHRQHLTVIKVTDIAGGK